LSSPELPGIKPTDWVLPRLHNHNHRSGSCSSRPGTPRRDALRPVGVLMGTGPETAWLEQPGGLGEAALMSTLTTIPAVGAVRSAWEQSGPPIRTRAWRGGGRARGSQIGGPPPPPQPGVGQRTDRGRGTGLARKTGRLRRERKELRRLATGGNVICRMIQAIPPYGEDMEKVGGKASH
jgi:hypothetical protein